MTFQVRTHVCADESDGPRPMFPSDDAERRRLNYWANPEQYRKQARIRYTRHRQRYAAASKLRMRQRRGAA